VDKGTSSRERPIVHGCTSQGFYRQNRDASPQNCSSAAIVLDATPPRRRAHGAVRGRERQRQAIRDELVARTGGARQAFRSLDRFGQGRVGPSAFLEAVDRLGVRWRYITGLRKARDLFQLFDTKNDGHLDMEELFPDQHSADEESKKQRSEAAFAQLWASTGKPDSQAFRGPRWTPSSGDDELAHLRLAAKRTEEHAKERQKMRIKIRNLKNVGASDALCREVVAPYLPRGTGPKDLDDVPTFSVVEAEACKRQYREQTTNSVRSIQKQMRQMMEQRRLLGSSLQTLRAVTAIGQEERMVKKHSIFENSAFTSSRSSVSARRPMPPSPSSFTGAKAKAVSSETE